MAEAEDTQPRPKIVFIGGSGRDMGKNEKYNKKYILPGRHNPVIPPCGFDKFITSEKKELQNIDFDNYVIDQFEYNQNRQLGQEEFLQQLLKKKPLNQMNTEDYITEEVVNSLLKWLYGNDLDKSSDHYQLLFMEAKISIIEGLDEYLSSNRNVTMSSQRSETKDSTNHSKREFNKKSVRYEQLDEIDSIDFEDSNSSNSSQAEELSQAFVVNDNTAYSNSNFKPTVSNRTATQTHLEEEGHTGSTRLKINATNTKIESGDFCTSVENFMASELEIRNDIDRFLIPKRELQVQELLIEESDLDKSKKYRIEPLRSLVGFDPRFSVSASVTKTFLYDGEDFGQRLLELLDNEIYKFPFGIELWSFMTHLKRKEQDPLYRIHIKPGFHTLLPDIFYINNTFKFYTKHDSPTPNGQMIILFPAVMRQFKVNINRLQYKIWHLYNILLLKLRRPISSVEAVSLMKTYFGIQFDPKDWGLSVESFFIDCMRKFDDNIHEMTLERSDLLSRRDFEKKPIFPLKLSSDYGPSVSKLKSDIQLASQDYSIEYQRKIVSFVSDMIEEQDRLVCYPQGMYNYNYLSVTPRDTWNLLDNLLTVMSKHYGDLRTASVFEIQPKSLKRGLLVAVYNPLEPKCKWSRAIILAKLSSTDYRVCEVDSGIILIVKIAHIRYLDVPFLKLPIQAIFCRFVSAGGENEKEQLLTPRKLIQRLEDKTFLVEFVKRDRTGIWEVEFDEVLHDHNGKFTLKKDILRNSLNSLRPWQEKMMYFYSPPKQPNYNSLVRRKACCFEMSSKLVRRPEVFERVDFLNMECYCLEISKLSDSDAERNKDKEVNITRRFYKY